MCVRYAFNKSHFGCACTTAKRSNSRAVAEKNVLLVVVVEVDVKRTSGGPGIIIVHGALFTLQLLEILALAT